MQKFKSIIYHGDLNKIKKITKENIDDLVEKIYVKFIKDLEVSFNLGTVKGQPYNKILIQIPTYHFNGFISTLKKTIPNTRLKNSVIEIVEFNYKNFHKEKDYIVLFDNFIKYILNFDKFINICSNNESLSKYINEYKINNFQKGRKLYLDGIEKFKKEKHQLRTYFPSFELAELEGMDLEKLNELYLNAISLDWGKIYQTNEELSLLFDNYDYIKVIGDNTNIKFGIKGKKHCNSVIKGNYPGAEVFTSPNINEVDGFIYVEDKNYFKGLDITVGKLLFKFHKGKLSYFEIHDNSLDKDTINKYYKLIYDKLNEKEGNKYLGEIAFGTNYNIPVGIKNKMLGEKAFGMHFALGHTFNIPNVDNGNGNTNIHRDIIKTIDDNSIYFGKENGEEILVINKGIYNKEICPMLYINSKRAQNIL